MKKNICRIATAITILGIATVLFLYIHTDKTNAANIRQEGGMPYTPTRTEWLTVTLNSLGENDLRGFGFSISYHPDRRLGHENTIRISCIYLPAKANRKVMNETMQIARNLVMQHAKIYGWETWVKIEEKVEPFKTY